MMEENKCVKSRYDFLNYILMPLGFVILPTIINKYDGKSKQTNKLYYLGKKYTKNARSALQSPKMKNFKLIKWEE